MALYNANLVSYANYKEAIQAAVGDLGTATPHIQALKLLAFMFDLPLTVVRNDCQDQFMRLRRLEQNQMSRRI